MGLFSLHLGLNKAVHCSVSCVGALRWESPHTSCFYGAGCRHAKPVLLQVTVTIKRNTGKPGGN